VPFRAGHRPDPKLAQLKLTINHVCFFCSTFERSEGSLAVGSKGVLLTMLRCTIKSASGRLLKNSHDCFLVAIGGSA